MKWIFDASCLQLADSKEGASIRPIGLPVIELLEQRYQQRTGTFVFAGFGEDNAFGGFPKQWKLILKGSQIADITAHVLRHSFASIANDLGFTEITIAALLGHAKGTVTSKYVHSLDTTLIMAADTVSGYIQGLLDGIEFRHTSYAMDRSSRKAALIEFLHKVANEDVVPTDYVARPAM